jgi:hypothetical protein
MPTKTHIFGIRHHGPGCARSLRAALQTLKPDCLLIEGPPDVNDAVLSVAADAGLKPPVALLVYAAEEKPAPGRPANTRAAFYPFAAFSPEWQALQYALGRKIPTRFMDLPLWHRFALEQAEAEKFAAELKAKLEARGGKDAPPDAADAPEADDHAAPQAAPPDDSGKAGVTEEQEPYLDPLSHLAKAAGYPDAELWWDRMIESRAAGEALDHADLFAAILEAMTALRDTLPPRPDRLGSGYERQREAWMRQTIRAAMKEGFENIAVVCGAWHAPALAPDRMPPEKEDAATLAKLPKIKTAAAWVPWTYGRLTSSSGYGAGVTSPGWYHHLFDGDAKVKKGKKPKDAPPAPVRPPHASALAITWMTKVARLLRKEDLDASSAHIIEAVRLAESLAALRDRPAPSLAELTEATRTILLFGDAAPLALIHDKLIVSERLGEVPPGVGEAAIAPLQLDLQRQQKRLRLSPEAETKSLELDLRKPNDLERSELLHRLNLLGIPWGETGGGGGRSKGTFKEIWQLKWEPEFAVRLIEVSALGNTIYDAASAHARRTAADAKDLPPVTGLLDSALQANLPELVAFLLKRVDALAAVAADVLHMMEAVPPLANVVRYGNVRKTDTALVGRVVSALLARIMAGLPVACGSLNDDAAAAMEAAISKAHAAVQLLYPPGPSGDAPADSPLADWLRTLDRLADAATLHGLVAGRVTRLLLDAGHCPSADAARRMSLALSQGNNPAQGAAWIEGFLKGSGLILLHDRGLWDVLDAWVTGLAEDPFTAVLPLLRRSFSQFPAPERAQMGQKLRRKTGGGPARHAPAGDLNDTRAAKVLPVLQLILG